MEMNSGKPSLVYKKFLAYCADSLDQDAPKIMKIVEMKYDSCSKEMRTSNEMTDLLERTMTNMKKEPSRSFVHLKDLVLQLKLWSKLKPNEKVSSHLQSRKDTETKGQYEKDVQNMVETDHEESRMEPENGQNEEEENKCSDDDEVKKCKVSSPSCSTTPIKDNCKVVLIKTEFVESHLQNIDSLSKQVRSSPSKSYNVCINNGNFNQASDILKAAQLQNGSNLQHQYSSLVYNTNASHEKSPRHRVLCPRSAPESCSSKEPESAISSAETACAASSFPSEGRHRSTLIKEVDSTSPEILDIHNLSKSNPNVIKSSKCKALQFESVSSGAYSPINDNVHALVGESPGESLTFTETCNTGTPSNDSDGTEIYKFAELSQSSNTMSFCDTSGTETYSIPENLKSLAVSTGVGTCQTDNESDITQLKELSPLVKGVGTSNSKTSNVDHISGGGLGVYNSHFESNSVDQRDSSVPSIVTADDSNRHSGEDIGSENDCLKASDKEQDDPDSQTTDTDTLSMGRSRLPSVDDDSHPLVSIKFSPADSDDVEKSHQDVTLLEGSPEGAVPGSGNVSVEVKSDREANSSLGACASGLTHNKPTDAHNLPLQEQENKSGNPAKLDDFDAVTAPSTNCEDRQEGVDTSSGSSVVKGSKKLDAVFNVESCDNDSITVNCEKDEPASDESVCQWSPLVVSPKVDMRKEERKSSLQHSSSIKAIETDQLSHQKIQLIADGKEKVTAVKPAKRAVLVPYIVRTEESPLGKKFSHQISLNQDKGRPKYSMNIPTNKPTQDLLDSKDVSSGDEFVTEANMKEKERVPEQKLSPEEERQQRHIKKLEKLLESLRDEIEKCQARELSFEDMEAEDSSYIYEDKLKKKFVAAWNKLCEITKRTVETGRPTERTIKFSSTRYKEINRRLERFLNKTKSFPDIHDVKHVIKMTNTKYKLGLSSAMIQNIAREAFVDIGEMLQSRRHEDFIATFGNRHTDAIRTGARGMDPYWTDPVLRKKLDSNRETAKYNLEKVIAKYTQLQENKGKDDNEDDDDEEEEEEEADKDKNASHKKKMKETGLSTGKKESSRKNPVSSEDEEDGDDDHTDKNDEDKSQNDKTQTVSASASASSASKSLGPSYSSVSDRLKDLASREVHSNKNNLGFSKPPPIDVDDKSGYLHSVGLLSLPINPYLHKAEAAVQKSQSQTSYSLPSSPASVITIEDSPAKLPKSQLTLGSAEVEDKIREGADLLSSSKGETVESGPSSSKSEPECVDVKPCFQELTARYGEAVEEIEDQTSDSDSDEKSDNDGDDDDDDDDDIIMVSSPNSGKESESDVSRAASPASVISLDSDDEDSNLARFRDVEDTAQRERDNQSKETERDKVAFEDELSEKSQMLAAVNLVRRPVQCGEKSREGNQGVDFCDKSDTVRAALMEEKDDSVYESEGNTKLVAQNTKLPSKKNNTDCAKISHHIQHSPTEIFDKTSTKSIQQLDEAGESADSENLKETDSANIPSSQHPEVQQGDLLEKINSSAVLSRLDIPNSPVTKKSDVISNLKEAASSTSSRRESSESSLPESLQSVVVENCGGFASTAEEEGMELDAPECYIDVIEEDEDNEVSCEMVSNEEESCRNSPEVVEVGGELEHNFHRHESVETTSTTTLTLSETTDPERTIELSTSDKDSVTCFGEPTAASCKSPTSEKPLSPCQSQPSPSAPSFETGSVDESIVEINSSKNPSSSLSNTTGGATSEILGSVYDETEDAGGSKNFDTQKQPLQGVTDANSGKETKQTDVCSISTEDVTIQQHQLTTESDISKVQPKASDEKNLLEEHVDPKCTEQSLEAPVLSDKADLIRQGLRPDGAPGYSAVAEQQAVTNDGCGAQDFVSQLVSVTASSKCSNEGHAGHAGHEVCESLPLDETCSAHLSEDSLQASGDKTGAAKMEVAHDKAPAQVSDEVKMKPQGFETKGTSGVNEDVVSVVTTIVNEVVDKASIVLHTDSVVVEEGDAEDVEGGKSREQSLAMAREEPQQVSCMATKDCPPSGSLDKGSSKTDCMEGDGPKIQKDAENGIERLLDKITEPSVSTEGDASRHRELASKDTEVENSGLEDCEKLNDSKPTDKTNTESEKVDGSSILFAECMMEESTDLCPTERDRGTKLSGQIQGDGEDISLEKYEMAKEDGDTESQTQQPDGTKCGEESVHSQQKDGNIETGSGSMGAEGKATSAVKAKEVIEEPEGDDVLHFISEICNAIIENAARDDMNLSTSSDPVTEEEKSSKSNKDDVSGEKHSESDVTPSESTGGKLNEPDTEREEREKSKDEGTCGEEDGDVGVETEPSEDLEDVTIIEELSNAKGVRVSSRSKEEDRKMVDVLLTAIRPGKKDGKSGPSEKPHQEDPGEASSDGKNVGDESKDVASPPDSKHSEENSAVAEKERTGEDEGDAQQKSVSSSESGAKDGTDAKDAAGGGEASSSPEGQSSESSNKELSPKTAEGEPTSEGPAPKVDDEETSSSSRKRKDDENSVENTGNVDKDNEDEDDDDIAITSVELAEPPAKKQKTALEGVETDYISHIIKSVYHGFPSKQKTGHPSRSSSSGSKSGSSSELNTDVILVEDFAPSSASGQPVGVYKNKAFRKGTPQNNHNLGIGFGDMRTGRPSQQQQQTPKIITPRPYIPYGASSTLLPQVAGKGKTGTLPNQQYSASGSRQSSLPMPPGMVSTKGRNMYRSSLSSSSTPGSNIYSGDLSQSQDRRVFSKSPRYKSINPSFSAHYGSNPSFFQGNGRQTTQTTPPYSMSQIRARGISQRAAAQAVTPYGLSQGRASYQARQGASNKGVWAPGNPRIPNPSNTAMPPSSYLYPARQRQISSHPKPHHGPPPRKALKNLDGLKIVLDDDNSEEEDNANSNHPSAAEQKKSGEDAVPKIVSVCSLTTKAASSSSGVSSEPKDLSDPTKSSEAEQIVLSDSD